MRAHDEQAPQAGRATLLAFDALLAAFFAFSLSAETLMDFTGDVRSVYPENFASAPDAGTACLFIVLLAAFLLAFRKLRKLLTPRDARERLDIPRAGDAAHPAAPKHAAANQAATQGLGGFLATHKLGFAGFWLLLMLAWTAVFLQYYPGTSMNDQITAIVAPVGMADVHPLVHNLLLAAFVRGSLLVFGGGNPGLAAFVVLQMAACAAAVALCCTWLRYRRAPGAAIALVLAFFLFQPLVTSYAVTVWKDTPFGYLMLLWIPFLAEAARNPGAFWQRRGNYVLLCLLMVATIWLRGNGAFIAVAVAVAVLIAHRASLQAKRAVASLAAAAILAAAPAAFLTAMDVHHPFRETVGVPLQQLAAVQEDGFAFLPAPQMEYLDTLLPTGKVETSYMPLFADGVKFTGWFDSAYLDGTRAAFAQTYLSALSLHPEVMARAYLSHTYGNWSLLAFAPDQSFELALSGNIPNGEFARTMEELGLENRSLYPQAVQERFSAVYPKLMVFPGPGATFALALLALFALTARARSRRPLLVFLPFFALWCTLMLASPLSTALRYVFPLVVALPFLTAAIFFPRGETAL